MSPDSTNGWQYDPEPSSVPRWQKLIVIVPSCIGIYLPQCLAPRKSVNFSRLLLLLSLSTIIIIEIIVSDFFFFFLLSQKCIVHSNVFWQ